MTTASPLTSESLASPAGLPDHVERLAASVVGLSTRRHAGSALLWRTGIAIGSASVLWRASRVALVLPGGDSVGGELIGIDPSTDLAALRYDSGAMPVADLGTGPAPRVGDFVFAVGRSTAGLTQASFGHVGSVAGEWRSWRGGRIDSLVRLDGGLYPGLEGAPVADAAGRLVGIGSAALSRHHGIVLPVATVERVLDQLLAHGRVPQAYLGIAAQTVRVTREGGEREALLVSSVAKDGPAARGGVQVADVIVALAGQPVASLDALRAALRVDAAQSLDVLRGGQPLSLEVTATERPSGRCG